MELKDNSSQLLVCENSNYHSGFLKVKRHMKCRVTIILMLCMVMLSGCFKDDDDNGGPPSANPAGYYDSTGTATVKQDDNTTDLMITDLQALVHGNQIKVMSMEHHLLYDGTITSISGDNYSATVTIFRNGEVIDTATVSGMITEGSTITGTLTGSGPGNGTFELVYALSNNQMADISDIELMNWFAVTNSFTRNFEIALTNNGEISASFATTFGPFAGCLVDTASNTNPEFQVINNSSLYSVNLIFNNCDTATLDGSYMGLASLKAADSLVIIISNDENAMYSNFDPD